MVDLKECTFTSSIADFRDQTWHCGESHRWTVRLMVVVCVSVPEVPRIRTENVPVDAVPLAVRVRVLAPEVLPGLKDALTPRGKPEADKFTLPAKPF